MPHDATRVAGILARGPAYESAPGDWRELTVGEGLFAACREAVRAGRGIEALTADIERWCDYVARPDMRSQAPAWQRDRVRALARCVRAAVHAPVQAPTDRMPAWERVCIRSLRGDAPHGPPVEVAIAGWDERARGSAAGLLASFRLEVLGGGADVVAQHPADAGVTWADAEFVGSMQDAWDAALAVTRSEGVELPPVDGRWRVTRGGQPAPELTGRSASAAALRGWYHALRDTIPDEGVIVVAQVQRRTGGGYRGAEHAFDVRAVDSVGIGPKVEAIVASGGFDTIVVARQNAGDVRADALPGNGSVRVVTLG